MYRLDQFPYKSYILHFLKLNFTLKFTVKTVGFLYRSKLFRAKMMFLRVIECNENLNAG